MPWTFNPFSGTFDQKGSGGGSSYLEGEVQNFSALPTATPPTIDAAYLVRESEGTWLLSRKPAGIYIRVATSGTRATDWQYAGEFPDVFNDANLVIYNNTDSTKNVKFDVSAVEAGTTRTITVPDKNITLDSYDQSLNTDDSPEFESLTISGEATTDSTLKLGTFEFQPYAINNCWIADNVYYDGSEWKYRANGAGGTFYFQGTEGQFSFGPAGDAGDTFPAACQFKINEDGTMAVGEGIGPAPSNLAGAFFVVKSASSQVGIGTGDPHATLDVAGEIQFADSTDPTKQVTFDVSGVTTETVRTLTIPNSSGTLALQGAITTSGLTQATARILGRTSASAGSIEEIQIGSGLSLSAGELSATGGSGGGEVRSDFVSPYTYTGLADAGASESTASWTIRRSEFDAGGGFVATLTASAVSWNNRLTASYA
jgi:hypothetical protein